MFKSLPLAAAVNYVFSRCFVRKIVGEENLPTAKNGIVVCNHQSLADGIFLCSALYRRTLQPPHPLVISAAFANPFFGWILRCAQAISIDRTEPPNRALQTALAYLRRNESVVIFPEGHLNNGKHLRLARSGAALLALESGAPIFPAGIRGSSEIFPVNAIPKMRRNVEIHFGEPLNVIDASNEYHRASIDRRRDLLIEINRQMMQRIADLCKIPPHRRQ